MMRTEVSLDHLVIAAADLFSGVEYVKQTLGVEMPYGGEHQNMATHNHLMRLGDHCFLEVIAINPDAAHPERPRWYGLDDPYLRAQISRQPRLVSWVVNTNNIEHLCKQAEFPFGKSELITRNNLNWYFTLPEDGRLLASGLIPYLMQWNTETHPAKNMADLGCRLKKLDIYHPNAQWLKAILDRISVCQFVTVNELKRHQAAYMIATVNTPSGLKELSSKI